MTSAAARFRNPAGDTGLVENLVALASALLEFFEARFALFAQDSKAALVRLLVLAACVVLALVFCALGYFFLVSSVIIGAAHLAGIWWGWTALATAGAHFVIALILLMIARGRMTKPFFSSTLRELKEDREWVKQLDLKNRSTS